MVGSKNYGFSLLGFFFAPSYYAGHGKILKGFILALIGAIPFLGLGAFIYGGINAKKDLLKEKSFNWAVAIGIYMLLSFLSALSYGAFSALLESSGENVEASKLNDISGIWRGVSDGAMVTLGLNGSNNYIDINGSRFQVDVKNVDSKNHIVSLNVRTNQGIKVWTIKQVFEDENTFTLLMTLSNGTQDRLTFIRNIQ